MQRNAEDYRVYSRQRPVGDIWLDANPERLEEQIAPWRWSVDTTNGGTDPSGWWASGRARTREEAMDAFRNAWDNYQPQKAVTPPNR
jgi:uncharacterized protein YbdZ (MbtH family)